MVNIFSLKDIGYRIAGDAHVIKAEQLSAVEEATGLIAQARETAAEIVRKSQDVYDSEKTRGFREGQAAARKESFERLVSEQGRLDTGLRKIDADLSELVFRTVRKVVDGIDDATLVETLTRSALKQMRREKRAQLRVSPQQYELLKHEIDRIIVGFPEIELVDVVEDPALQPLQIVLESDIGRVDGDLGRTIDDLEGAVRRALTNLRAKTQDFGEATVAHDD